MFLSASNLEKGEKLRSRLRFFMILSGILHILGFILLIYFTKISIFECTESKGCTFILVLFLFAISHCLVCTPLSKRCHNYYFPFLEQDLKNIFDNYAKNESGNLLEYTIKNSGMTKRKFSFVCQSSFSGRYHNIPFLWSYIKLNKPRKNGNLDPYFSGIWLTFDRPVTFREPIIILEEGRKNERYPRCYEKEIYEIQKKGFPLFGKFHVFSSDSSYTLDFLDEDLKQRILDLSYKKNGSLLIGFIENQIHIACDCRVKSTDIPILGDIQPVLQAFQEEQIEWTKTVIDCLWARKTK